MNIQSEQFTIEQLIALKDRIDPKPQYQRTPVWKIDRKKLLVDSIFRGYDLPKFYFNSVPGNSFFDYEICDGQQRFRSIIEFVNDKFPVGKGLWFRDQELSGKIFSHLSFETKAYFHDYSLTVAVITNGNQNEIRDLFARLQKGMGLNQAELRKALSTHIGSFVESIVDNHRFFKTCEIPNIRNKHQDYIDHAIAFLVNAFEKDFKGQFLRDVYVNISPDQAIMLIKNLSSNLEEMERINSYSPGIFKNKWIFVDSFILIYQNQILNKKVQPREYQRALVQFEIKRKENSKFPNRLIEKPSPSKEDKMLYEYITAFTKDGALKANMIRRNRSFDFNFHRLFR